MMMSPRDLSERYIGLAQYSKNGQAEMLIKKAIAADPYNPRAWISLSKVSHYSDPLINQTTITIADVLHDTVTHSLPLTSSHTLRVGFLTIDTANQQ